MKPTTTFRHRICAFFVASSLIITCLHSQENADPYKKPGAAKPAPAAKQESAADEAASPYLIQTTVEWIEVKTADAVSLLRGADAPNSEAMIQKIRALEMNGQATVVETASVIAKTGERANSESGKEFRYAAEYEALEASKLKHVDLSNNQLKEPRIAITTEAQSTQQPNGFEMRQLGARMEVEPVVGPDNRTIDLALQPEMTLHAGTVSYGTVRLGGENMPLVEQPVFASSRSTIHLTLLSGQTILASVQTPHNQDGEPERDKKWLILVRAVAFPVKAK